jgi:hypothetical protein
MGAADVLAMACHTQALLVSREWFAGSSSTHGRDTTHHEIRCWNGKSARSADIKQSDDDCRRRQEEGNALKKSAGVLALRTSAMSNKMEGGEKGRRSGGW